MNKTFNFIFGTVGTAGTMEVVEVFPGGPDEINSLIVILVKTVISLLGGMLTTRIANLVKPKRTEKKSMSGNSLNVKSTKNY